MSSKIPSALLKLLSKSEWKPTDGYSAFESGFSRDGRAADPSYYIVRPGGELLMGDGFTFEEAKELNEAGVFGSAVKVGEGHLGINEHAQHALTDFLAETVDAWQKYQSRLSTIERAARDG